MKKLVLGLLVVFATSSVSALKLESRAREAAGGGLKTAAEKMTSSQEDRVAYVILGMPFENERYHGLKEKLIGNQNMVETNSVLRMHFEALKMMPNALSAALLMMPND